METGQEPSSCCVDGEELAVVFVVVRMMAVTAEGRD